MSAGQGNDRIRIEMCITLQHLPVLMSRDQRYLLDFEARLEQAACAFVAKVMKVQVFNAEVDDAALVDRYPARLARARQALRIAFDRRGGGKKKGSACIVWKTLGLEPLQALSREEAA